MDQILEPEARDRLGRIRLVKESRATDVENRLLMLAQSGQLRQKVTEEQLKDLLGAIAEKQREEEEENKIVYSHRKGGWDDDDDLLDSIAGKQGNEEEHKTVDSRRKGGFDDDDDLLDL